MEKETELSNDIDISIDTLRRSHSNSTHVKNKKNLNENLLSKFTDKIFGKRQSKVELEKPPVKEETRRNAALITMIKSASAFAVSPLEDEDSNYSSQESEEEEEEKEEKPKENKVEFNQVVEDMAKFYIKEDQISNFYFKQFLETILIHIFYFYFGPLSTPLLFKIFGKNFVRNMGLWGKKVGSSHLVQIIYWITFVLTSFFTIFILLSPKDSSWKLQFVFLSPAYISQIMILIRYITVCVKYGFYPPEYYNKWKTTRLTRTEVKSNFLLQGWIKPSLLVLDVYLKEIFQKLNIDINQFEFQCVGKLPENMKDNLLQIDALIKEDAKRIRLSIFRRIKKENKFFETIQDVIKIYKIGEDKTKKFNDENKIDNNNNNDSLERNLNNSTINDYISSKNKIELKKNSLAKERLRDVIILKVLPQVRIKIHKDKSNLESKVNFKNENVYEINGIYLCRAILKEVFTVNLEDYAFMHKFFVFIICLVPFIFTYTYYHYFNLGTLIVGDKTIVANNLNNNTFSNSTLIDSFKNYTISNQTNLQYLAQPIKVSYVTVILLLFSAVSLVPPVWLNTLNLLYGLVDIRRKRKIMEIITEMINTNITENKRKYPLFNVINSNTMLNWYYLRNLFLEFGKRFSDRIILQTSIFCVFVVISLVILILSLFGFLNIFIAMCIGVCFTLTVFINFTIIFRMFLLGADFNFAENHHIDLMMTHKIFIDEIVNNTKIQRFFRKNSCNKHDTNYDKMKKYDIRETLKGTFRESMTGSICSMNEPDRKRSITNQNNKDFIIPNNANSQIFYEAITSDESILKLQDFNTFFMKSSRVLENIKEKIRIDSIVRPLKIFWIKADYKIVSQIVAVMGTGIGLVLGSVIKTVDLTNIIQVPHDK